MAQVLEVSTASCWTGRVAAWAPFPPPPPPPQQQQGGLPPLKTSARGVWLRSEQGGVLMLQWRAGVGPPLLTFTLRNSQQLVRAPLAPGSFAFRLVCPAHGAPPPAAGGSSGHVLFLSLAGSSGNAGGNGGSGGMHGGMSGGSGGGATQQGRTLAVHFDTVQAGWECGALLQAVQQGLAEVAPQPQVAAPAGADGGAIGGAAVASGSHPAAVVLPLQGGGRAAAAAAAAAQDFVHDGADLNGTSGGRSRLFGFPDETSLAAAVQAALSAPGFDAYVDQWEQELAQLEPHLGQYCQALRDTRA